MTDDRHHDERDFSHEAEDTGDPAQAFEALRNAVEAHGLEHGARLDRIRDSMSDALHELHGTLSQEAGKIVQVVSTVSKRMEAVEKSPLLNHGPDYYANTIERAGRNLVSTAAEKLDRQSGDLERITRQLTNHVQGALQRRQQDRRLLLAGGIGLGFGILATLLIPWVLPSTVGMSVATTAMNADRWNAGMALMKSVDSATWNQMVEGYNLVRGNAPVLADCRQAALQTGKEQKCSVFVLAPETAQ